MYEALIYGNINQYSARDFITGINEANPKDIKVRVNSDGGEVRYGWGMLAKLADMPGKKLFCNDGEANSMAAIAFCYADDAESIREGTFTFHRAAYYDETNMSADEKNYLVALNKKLRAAFEAKVDTALFAMITGVTPDQMFSMDGRVEAMINADAAMRCGLINRVTDLDLTAKAEITKKLKEVKAQYTRKPATATTEITPTKKTMTLQELQREHPAVYAEVFKAGADEAFDIAGAALAFIDVDKKGAIAAFESRKPISAKQMAEFGLKAMAQATKGNLEADSAVATQTDGTASIEKTAAEKIVAAAAAKSTYFREEAKK